MGFRVLTRLGALCAAAAAMTGAVDAAADSTHYYALLLNNSIYFDADDGAFINIQMNQLHSTCNVFTHNFVNHELWYGTVAGGNYWVEAGYKDGVDGSGSCHTDVMFWADNRPGGGYHEHYPNVSWSLGTWYSTEIATAGNCSWNVWQGGVNLGTSTGNCPGNGRALNAGIETTSQTTGTVGGYLSGWWEQSNGAQWTQSWDNPQICQTQTGGSCGGTGNPRIQFLNGQTETEEVLNENF